MNDRERAEGSSDVPTLPDTYAALLAELRARIGAAQVRAAVAVNTELVTLYWQVGHALNERVKQAGWGAKVLDQLSRDLKLAFPELGGFSPRNLRYMRQFAAAWPAPEFWQAPLAKLSWYHHLCGKAEHGRPGKSRRERRHGDALRLHLRGVRLRGDGERWHGPGSRCGVCHRPLPELP